MLIKRTSDHTVLLCDPKESVRVARAVSREILNGAWPKKVSSGGDKVKLLIPRKFTVQALDLFPQAKRSPAAKRLEDKREAFITGWIRELVPIEDEDIPGFTGEMMPFQRIGVAAALSMDSFWFTDQMGLGKSLEILATLAVRGAYPALIFCPNTFKWGWGREIEKFFPELRYVIVDGPAKVREEQLNWITDIVIINYEAARLHPELADLAWEAVVMDECVKYDTLLTTPRGPRKISEIRNGDLVLGYDHDSDQPSWTVVKGIRRSSMRDTVRVGDLEITPDHPIAVSLESTWCYDADYAISKRSLVHLPVVQEENRSAQVQQEGSEAKVLLTKLCEQTLHEQAGSSNQDESFEQESKTSSSSDDLRVLSTSVRVRVRKAKLSAFLFEVMFKPSSQLRSCVEGAEISSDERVDSETGCSQETRQAYSDAKSRPRDSDEDDSNLARSWSLCSYIKRGERTWSYRSAAEALRSSWERVGYGACSGHKVSTNGISDQLQVGSGERKKEDWDRSPWDGSSEARRDRQRSKEEEFFGTAWLEDNLDLERRDSERYLWNIETTTGNYFANGLLVHNCHRAKNPSAKLTQAIHQIQAPVKLAASGTPILNGRLEELWSPLHWLYPDKFPGDMNTTQPDWLFRRRYCIIRDGEIVAYRRIPELRRKLHSVSIRRTKAEVLPDLPEMIHSVRDVELTKEQRKLYKSIRDDMKLWMDDGTSKKIVDVLAEITRLKQACFSPELYGGSKVSGKLEELKDIVEELTSEGHKAIVFSQWAKACRIIERELSDYSMAYVDGSVKGSKREKQIRTFQEDQACQLYIGTIGANREGITLTEASYVIFTDLMWTPAYNSQAAARAHRIGQKKLVHVLELRAKNTIEEHINEVLEDKQMMNDLMTERSVVPRQTKKAIEKIQEIL